MPKPPARCRRSTCRRSRSAGQGPQARRLHHLRGHAVGQAGADGAAGHRADHRCPSAGRRLHGRGRGRAAGLHQLPPERRLAGRAGGRDRGRGRPLRRHRPGRRQDVPGRVHQRQPDRAAAHGLGAQRRAGRRVRERAGGRGLADPARILRQRRRHADAHLRGDALPALSAGARPGCAAGKPSLPGRVHARPGAGTQAEYGDRFLRHARRRCHHRAE